MTVLKICVRRHLQPFHQGRPRSRTFEDGAFHFSRVRNETLPSVDLGYAPFTGTTPLFFFFFFFFFFKIRALRAHLLRGARTQPAGYTTGYKRAALD